ncbi:CST complex subunit Stn1 N-terminal domain-containing protein [Pleurotus pulmonarius]
MTSSPLKRQRSPSLINPSVSNLDLWKWTLTNDAIAPCFIRDVLLMRECQSQKDVDYFWLGRVPCRTATIVGIVVGVNVFEKRTVYTVDDGTGVVDCSLRVGGSRAPNLSVKPSASPQRLKLKHPSSQATKNVPNPSYSLFAFKPLPTEDPVLNVSQPIALAKAPKRIFVGAFVQIQGRVSKLHHGRQIIVQEIEAVSVNHEIQHRNTVRSLHRTRYNPSLGPFIPPIAESATASKLPTTPTRPRFPTWTADVSPSTPKQKPRRCYSPMKSNVTESSYMTGTDYSESEYSECSPRKTQKMPVASLKLRHPSRLHSRDLTANTFRIYLKYYMDELDNITHLGFPRDVSTPRKHHVLPTWCEETPRPSKIQPRTALPPDGEPNFNGDFTKKGFTMSFLRRIPELAFLAKRVVEAEAKRRAKEERGKTRTAKVGSSTGIRPDGDRGVSQTTSTPAPIPHRAAAKLTRQGSRDKENTVQARGRDPRDREAATCPKDNNSSKDNPGPKMKRLFTFSIRKLYDEGSIVLWDGPTHPYPSKYGFIPHNDGLWKISSKSAAATQMLSDSLSLSTTFSTTCDSASISCSKIPDMDLCLRDIEGELSDPGEDEEAYISLTPAHFAPLVEEAIEVLMGRMRSANTSNGNTRREPTIHSHSGPTRAQITSYLQRKDSRWAKIGEWKVDEALTLLQDSGKIWTVSGHGSETRWEKCL